MTRKTYIPYGKGRIIVTDERGKRKLMRLDEVNVNFFGEAPVTNESITTTSEITNQLSIADDKLERALALLDSLDNTLGSKIDIYLENDEEGKDEFRKLFTLLDIIAEEIQTAKTITYSVNMRNINNNTK